MTPADPSPTIEAGAAPFGGRPDGQEDEMEQDRLMGIIGSFVDDLDGVMAIAAMQLRDEARA